MLHASFFGEEHVFKINFMIYPKGHWVRAITDYKNIKKGEYLQIKDTVDTDDLIQSVSVIKEGENYRLFHSFCINHTPECEYIGAIKPKECSFKVGDWVYADRTMLDFRDDEYIPIFQIREVYNDGDVTWLRAKNGTRSGVIESSCRLATPLEIHTYLSNLSQEKKNYFYYFYSR